MTYIKEIFFLLGPIVYGRNRFMQNRELAVLLPNSYWHKLTLFLKLMMREYGY